MRYKTSIVVILLVIAYLTLLVFLRGTRPTPLEQRADEIDKWWVIFSTSLLDNIESQVSQKSYLAVIEQRNVIQERTGVNYKFPVSFTREEFVQALKRYIRQDLLPFITSIIKQAPLKWQDQLIDRLVSRPLPRVELELFLTLAAAVNHSDAVIIFNPAVIENNYSRLRDIISHEIVHYFIQGLSASEDNLRDMLREGVTEYLTIKGAEELNWEYQCRAYRDEAAAVSLLVGIGCDNLLDWYFTDGAKDESIYPHLAAMLVRTGVDQAEADELCRDWQFKFQIEFYNRIKGAEALIDQLPAVVNSLSTRREILKLQTEKAELDASAEKMMYWLKLVEQEMVTIPATEEDKNFLTKERADLAKDAPFYSDLYTQHIGPLLLDEIEGKTVSQPTPPQQLLLEVAGSTTGRERIVKIISRANGLLVEQYLAIRTRAQEFRKRLEHERHQFREKIATEKQLLKQLRYKSTNLLRRLLQLLLRAKVDIPDTMNKANVPQIIRAYVLNSIKKID